MTIALGLVGCADTAVLELTIELPPMDFERKFVFVQARSGDRPFDEEWSPESSVGGLLPSVERVEATVSVVSDADFVEDPMRLKVRFCRSAECDGLLDEAGDPSEYHVVFDRPFYAGERTAFTLRIPATPPPCSATVPCPPERIDAMISKCEIEGCADGQSAPFCDSGSVHFCE